MFLQGDLQVVFDALFQVGAIDPVLQLDWEQVTLEMTKNPQAVKEAMDTINNCGGDKELLIEKLVRMDARAVHYIAMEVAREFVEFQDRSCLH